MNFLKKLFSNRFFVLVLCAAVLISIIPAVLTAMGQGSYVHSALQTVASPFQWCFSVIGEGLGGYSEYFTTLDSLRTENAELKARLAELEDEAEGLDLLEEENEFLRAYLGTKSEHTDFEFTDAAVVGWESTNYSTVCTLSKGSLAGVEKYMPVVTDDGLYGYVSEVGSTWCRVTPVTDSDSAAGACIERSGVTGVVKGNLSLRLDGLCKMVYIDGDADVREGDTVITSGDGSIYPRGIVIGTVTAVSADPQTRTLVATVKTAAGQKGISKMMIVTSYGYGEGGTSDD